jgi:hypothetical protein
MLILSPLALWVSSRHSMFISERPEWAKSSGEGAAKGYRWLPVDTLPTGAPESEESGR